MTSDVKNHEAYVMDLEKIPVQDRFDAIIKMRRAFKCDNIEDIFIKACIYLKYYVVWKRQAFADDVLGDGFDTLKAFSTLDFNIHRYTGTCSQTLGEL